MSVITSIEGHHRFFCWKSAWKVEKELQNCDSKVVHTNRKETKILEEKRRKKVWKLEKVREEGDQDRKKEINISEEEL